MGHANKDRIYNLRI